MSETSESPELMILHQHGFPDTRHIVEVVRRTKTQIIVRHGDHERRFMAQGGREVGSSDSWTFASVYEATPELLATVREEAKRRVMLARIRGTEWHKLTTAQLVAVVAVLTAKPEVPA